MTGLGKFAFIAALTAVALPANAQTPLELEYEAAQKALNAAIKRHGALPRTPIQSTPSGGRHLLFRRGCIAIGNSKKPIKVNLPGCDTRDTGGYILVAPSIVRGRRYEWRVRPSAEPIADAPSWLMDLVTQLPDEPDPSGLIAMPAGSVTPYAARALDAECERVANAGKGNRNSTLNEAAWNLGQLAAGGELSADLVRARLTEAARACHLIVDDGPRQVAATIDSGLQAFVYGY